MILVITEKPSVALAVSKVLGAYKREDGYYEGSGYIVSWCVGHLVELAKPEDYDEKYAKWRYSDLPILPDEWKTVVSPDSKKQFAMLKKLMHRKDVESVVNGCDAGREGESIFRMTYELAECKKPMLRLWVSSMEDSAIRDGFQNLRPGSDYDRLYCAAQSRSKADWLVGINATRLFSVQYGKRLTVGRVQTPTLAMLTDRKSQMDNFQKEVYYKVHIEKDGLELTAEEQFDKDRAEALVSKCENKDAKITSAECVKKHSKPPKLYDLTTLQREANRYYGFTAKQTLDYTQKLYEAKLVTYPRTDSRYLTEDMKDTAYSIVLALSEKLSFISGKASNFCAEQMIDNTKVTDHHAIIPTKASLNADISYLGKGEQAIYMLIAQRMLCAASETMEYQERTVKAECEGVEFSVKGKTILSKGWTAIEEAFAKTLSEKRKDEDEKDIPQNVEAGMIMSRVNAYVSEHFTSPPKPYTEDSLLAAMENAGKGEFEKETEKKGLGTPATRAGIIEKLVSGGYVERKGKQLVATEDAVKLISLLPDTVKSPTMTAEWENKLLLMERGEVSGKAFMVGITDFVKGLVTDYSVVSEQDKQSFTEKLREKAAQIGTCPRCGGEVSECKIGYACEKKDCNFVLWKDNKFMKNIGLSLTKAVATSLVIKGFYVAKNLTSKKTGKKYSAKILLVDNGEKYPGYDMEFINDKKKEIER